MKCDFCRETSVIHVRHTDKWFCEEHLVASVEKKVLETVQKTFMINRNDKVLVAASGGKDSTNLLHILHKNFPKVEALFIDEGIKNYRERSKSFLKKFCKKHKITLHTSSFKEEFGTTTDQIVKLDSTKTSPCSKCGVLRRYLINKKALELGADKLVTGHNLDDTCQDILMNIFQFNMEKLARTKSISPSFVQRIKPFRRVSERESMAYSIIKGFESNEGACPYVSESFRSLIREELNDLEFKFHGSKVNLQMIFDRLVPNLEKKVMKNRLNKCENCGGPTSRKVCKTCQILEQLK